MGPGDVKLIAHKKRIYSSVDYCKYLLVKEDVIA